MYICSLPWKSSPVAACTRLLLLLLPPAPGGIPLAKEGPVQAAAMKHPRGPWMPACDLPWCISAVVLASWLHSEAGGLGPWHVDIS